MDVAAERTLDDLYPVVIKAEEDYEAALGVSAPGIDGLMTCPEDVDAYVARLRDAIRRGAPIPERPQNPLRPERVY
jgi:DNA-binding NarL/FixJ family response regulator